MYVLFGTILIVCILFFILGQCRRRQIICRICRMDDCVKFRLLNELLSPFGFSYLPSHNIITSKHDAWQRGFGYQSLFDKTAVHFNILFDCEPVYFDYDGRTWRIEIWKGQYGINLGGEIGIYYADTLLSPDEYDTAHFESVPDWLMMPLSMEIFQHKECTPDSCFQTCPVFCVAQKHWWLTGFYTGKYCRPEDLSMKVSITFPNETILQSFVRALIRTGYEQCGLSICHLTVSFVFTRPHSPHPCSTCFLGRLSCWKARLENRLFCRLYLLVTRPFTCTADRILYLYFFLPFSFRRLLLFRKNRCQGPRQKRFSNLKKNHRKRR